jgi:hypothetical protein
MIAVRNPRRTVESLCRTVERRSFHVTSRRNGHACVRTAATPRIQESRKYAIEQRRSEPPLLKFAIREYAQACRVQ